MSKPLIHVPFELDELTTLIELLEHRYVVLYDDYRDVEAAKIKALEERLQEHHKELAEWSKNSN